MSQLESLLSPPVSVPPLTPPVPFSGEADDPWRYGWRYRPRTLPDGKVEIVQIPLSLDDLLYP